jgi:hypothetical protein
MEKVMKKYEDFINEQFALCEKENAVAHFVRKHPFTAAGITGAAFGGIGGAMVGAARGTRHAMRLGASMNSVHVRNYARVGAAGGASAGAVAGAMREPARVWGINNRKKHPVLGNILAQDGAKSATTGYIATKGKK